MTDFYRIGSNDVKALNDVLALLHECFAYMEGRIDPPSSLHSLMIEDIARQAEAGEIWAFGTPPVACVFFTPKTDSLYLGKLAVHNSERGKGVARHLVALAQRRAEALGKSYLELQTRIELTENHAVFEKLGFVRTSTSSHPGYDQITECTMRKQVRTSEDS